MPECCTLTLRLPPSGQKGVQASCSSRAVTTTGSNQPHSLVLIMQREPLNMTCASPQARTGQSFLDRSVLHLHRLAVLVATASDGRRWRNGELSTASLFRIGPLRAHHSLLASDCSAVLDLPRLVVKSSISQPAAPGLPADWDQPPRRLARNLSAGYFPFTFTVAAALQHMSGRLESFKGHC